MLDIEIEESVLALHRVKKILLEKPLFILFNQEIEQ